MLPHFRTNCSQEGIREGTGVKVGDRLTVVAAGVEVAVMVTVRVEVAIPVGVKEEVGVGLGVGVPAQV
jgi:hypothetical protein